MVFILKNVRVTSAWIFNVRVEILRAVVMKIHFF